MISFSTLLFLVRQSLFLTDINDFEDYKSFWHAERWDFHYLRYLWLMLKRKKSNLCEGKKYLRKYFWKFIWASFSIYNNIEQNKKPFYPFRSSVRIFYIIKHTTSINWFSFKFLTYTWKLVNSIHLLRIKLDYN